VIAEVGASSVPARADDAGVGQLAGGGGLIDGGVDVHIGLAILDHCRSPSCWAHPARRAIAAAARIRVGTFM